MKKVVFVFAAIAMISANLASANEGSMLSANLDRIHMAPEHVQQIGEIQRGNVAVRLADKAINLMLARVSHCPPGRLCAMMLPAPFIVELPLVSQKKDSCGSITYTAKRDLRPVDGNLVQIVVVDNTENRCPHFVAMPATQVSYTTQSSGFGHTNTKPVTSTMTGDRLAAE